jgi:hypothetical protein
MTKCREEHSQRDYLMETSLTATPPVSRVKLGDLTGGRARPRAREVGTIYRSTAAQREAERAFNRGLAMEQKGYDRIPADFAQN